MNQDLSKYLQALDDLYQQGIKDPASLEEFIAATYRDELKRKDLTAQNIYQQWTRRNARRRLLVPIKD